MINKAPALALLTFGLGLAIFGQQLLEWLVP